MATIFVLALLAVWAALALRSIRRGRKSGGCTGCCGGCAASCGGKRSKCRQEPPREEDGA